MFSRCSLVDAGHRDEVADAARRGRPAALGEVAGGERVDEVAAGPREGVGAGSIASTASRSRTVIGRCARARGPRHRRGRARHGAHREPQRRRRPPRRGGALERRLRDLVAQVQRQRRRGIDRRRRGPGRQRQPQQRGGAVVHRWRQSERRGRQRQPVAEGGQRRAGHCVAARRPARPRRSACRRATSVGGVAHLPARRRPSGSGRRRPRPCARPSRRDLEAGRRAQRPARVRLRRRSAGCRSAAAAGPAPNASPCATAHAVRRPVKAPGPWPKAMASRSGSAMPAPAPAGRRIAAAAWPMPRAARGLVDEPPRVADERDGQRVGGGVESQQVAVSAGRWRGEARGVDGGVGAGHGSSLAALLRSSCMADARARRAPSSPRMRLLAAAGRRGGHCCAAQ